MTVREHDLIRQSFEMLDGEATTSKDLFVSRVRLLALALQSADRDLEEERVRSEVLHEAVGRALDILRRPAPSKGKNAEAILEEAFAGHAATASARFRLRHEDA